jgi:hypothetical protein
MNDDASIHGMLARIDERTENTQHRLRNLEQRFDAYATNRDLLSVTDRVERLENNQTWVTRAVVGAWIGGLGVIAFGKKLFIG